MFQEIIGHHPVPERLLGEVRGHKKHIKRVNTLLQTDVIKIRN